MLGPIWILVIGWAIVNTRCLHHILLNTACIHWTNLLRLIKVRFSVPTWSQVFLNVNLLDFLILLGRAQPVAKTLLIMRCPYLHCSSIGTLPVEVVRDVHFSIRFTFLDAGRRTISKRCQKNLLIRFMVVVISQSSRVLNYIRVSAWSIWNVLKRSCLLVWRVWYVIAWALFSVISSSYVHLGFVDLRKPSCVANNVIVSSRAISVVMSVLGIVCSLQLSLNCRIFIHFLN